jgi:hypothetical protein
LALGGVHPAQAKSSETQEKVDMKNLIVLLALAASMIACETNGGVIESKYDGQNGSHLRLQQYKSEGRFFYSLSAWRPTHACELGELKVVAMGSGGKVSVRVEHAPGGTCEST